MVGPDMSSSADFGEGPHHGPLTPPGVALPLVLGLSLVIFVHAIDRGSLATAGPELTKELGRSNTAFGILLSAYFWTYIPGQFLAGWAIDRFGAHRTIAAGLLVFSLATLFSGLAFGFGSLLILRLLVGLGESASFPGSSKLIAQNLPIHRLGISNAMIGAGLMLGNGVGVMLGAIMISLSGWRPSLFLFGLLSLLVFAIWTRVGPRNDAGEATAARGAEPSYRAIVSRREAWGASGGHFAFNYPYLLLMTWMPTYLVRQYGFSVEEMGLLAGAFYVLSASMGILIGHLTDRRIAAGADANRLRRRMLIAAGVIMIACMLGCASGQAPIAIAALIAYSVANGLSGVNTFAAGQTLAGPAAAGKWMAVQNSLGGLAGILAPVITGFVIDLTGYFQVAFLIAALIALVGIGFWTIIIRRIEPLDWGSGHRACGKAANRIQPAL